MQGIDVISPVADGARLDAATPSALGALVATASDLFLVIGADGRVRYANRASVHILGYDPADLIGRLPWDFLHPTDLDEAMARFERKLATGGDRTGAVVRARHRDGTWRHLEVLAENLVDNPNVRGLACTARDVTARVRTEARLAHQTDVLRSIAEGAPLSAVLDRIARMIDGTVDGNVSIVVLDGDDHAEREWTRAQDGSWSIPVVGSDGRGIGIICARFADAAGPNDEERAVLDAGADLAKIAIERTRDEARLVHQATHDSLTGLPNRTVLMDRLGVALGRSARGIGSVALLLLDLDQFKVVNDSLGHATGDWLLCMVAERLASSVRPGDTVCRLGGDEFVMLCDGLNGEIDAIGIAGRIADVLDDSFELNDVEITVSGSIGIAVTTGTDADPEALLRDADAAMFRAKERGRDRWALFDEALRADALTRLGIEAALRGSIERGEFFLEYQPQVSLEDGRVVGVEALLRWRHPELGTVSPEEFIRVAEETGLIVPIGRWVLWEACRQLRAWELADPDRPPLTVCVNMSARQLASRDLVKSVARTVAETGVNPRALSIEITETTLMEDVDRAAAMLRALKNLGIRLWVDDFGTGYSSLAYLRRLPIDGLKVDRAFVAGLGVESEDSAIVAGIVRLAHTLGLSALAEGVETPLQLAQLRALHCDLGQGYHWAPSLSPTDLQAWLAAG